DQPARPHLLANSMAGRPNDGRGVLTADRDNRSAYYRCTADLPLTLGSLEYSDIQCSLFVAGRGVRNRRSKRGLWVVGLAINQKHVDAIVVIGQRQCQSFMFPDLVRENTLAIFVEWGASVDRTGVEIFDVSPDVILRYLFDPSVGHLVPETLCQAGRHQAIM